jgi:hypothetical protein
VHLSDTEAAQRVADNDNLMGELVGALSSLLEAVRPYVYPTPDKSESLWAKVERARAVLAKAQGAQQ